MANLKQRTKMYKAGKHWIAASLTSVSIIAGISGINVLSVHADDNDENTNEMPATSSVTQSATDLQKKEVTLKTTDLDAQAKSDQENDPVKNKASDTVSDSQDALAKQKQKQTSGQSAQMNLEAVTPTANENSDDSTPVADDGTSIPKGQYGWIVQYRDENNKLLHTDIGGVSEKSSNGVENITPWDFTANKYSYVDNTATPHASWVSMQNTGELQIQAMPTIVNGVLITIKLEPVVPLYVDSDDGTTLSTGQYGWVLR